MCIRDIFLRDASRLAKEFGASVTLLHVDKQVERKKTKTTVFKSEIELSEARQIINNTLTPREKEILHLMVNGLSTKEIAYDLKISNRTLEAHRQNMMVKLDAGDMTMLVCLAVTHKLVQLD
mgnify:CR=1 FL=1